MIHVLIERLIADGMESNYEEAAKDTLHTAYTAAGFVNGETFYDMQDSNHRYVMSKWRSSQDWLQWYNSDSRKEMMNRLNPMMDKPEHITLLEN